MDRSAWLLSVTAILLWSGLAACAVALKGHPPSVSAGLALLIGGLLSVHRWREWEVPHLTRLVGVGGILGYHLLYFAAFNASDHRDVEVNLLNYLWPLLLVFLAPLILPKIGWSWRHLLGALLGFLGVAVILVQDGLQPDLATLDAYGLAVAAAVVWALYSLLTKRLPPFPTAAVGGFCLVSGVGALIYAALVHGSLMVQLGAFVWWQWIIIVGMGLGPMGAAFFCWDAALKRGDPRIIGALAYLAPLLSSLWICLFGDRTLGWPIGLALVLILSGAGIASWSVKDRPAKKG